MSRTDIKSYTDFSIIEENILHLNGIGSGQFYVTEGPIIHKDEQASGKLLDTRCIQQHILYARGDFSNCGTKTIEVYRTNQGVGNINTDWKLLYQDSNSLLLRLYGSEACATDSNGCPCLIGTGGFHETNISLKIDVRVNLLDFCTKENNINHDVCFKYLSEYMADEKSDRKTQVIEYAKEYCDKYKGLSIFNLPRDTSITDKDYNFCGCNMNPDYYGEFYKSLTKKYSGIDLSPLRPSCLLPHVHKVLLNLLD